MSTLTLDYSAVVRGGRKTYTFIGSDGDPLTVTANHPRFREIDNYLTVTDDSRIDPTVVLELIDYVDTAVSAVTQLSEHLSYQPGRGLLYDDIELDNALVGPLEEAILSGGTDYGPQVAFLGKVYRNPDPVAIDGLIKWIAAERLSITDDGDVIGYKGVIDTGGDSVSRFRSVASGPNVSVNGTRAPSDRGVAQDIGDVVTMPRYAVDSDPQSACSAGLHVGTRRYASAFQSVVLVVQFDPADVVAVPRDHEFEKVRVSRYRVKDVDSGSLLRAGLITAQPLTASAVASVSPTAVVPDFTSAVGAVAADPTAAFRKGGHYSAQAIRTALAPETTWEEFYPRIQVARGRSPLGALDFTPSTYIDYISGREVPDFTLTVGGASALLGSLDDSRREVLVAREVVESASDVSARTLFTQLVGYSWEEFVLRVRRAAERVPSGSLREVRLADGRSDYLLNPLGYRALLVELSDSGLADEFGDEDEGGDDEF